MNLRMQCRGTFGKTFMSCSVSTDDTCQLDMGEKKKLVRVVGVLSARCPTGGSGSPQSTNGKERREKRNCGETSDKQILTG